MPFVKFLSYSQWWNISHFFLSYKKQFDTDLLNYTLEFSLQAIIAFYIFLQ